MNITDALAMASVRRALFFGVLLALFIGGAVGRFTSPVTGLEVTFYNAGDFMIESISLDFGSADTQSSIQAFRIPPGKARTLVLNHAPGMGFNVQVNYPDGRKQEFCALRGDMQVKPRINLKL